MGSHVAKGRQGTCPPPRLAFSPGHWTRAARFSKKTLRLLHFRELIGARWLPLSRRFVRQFEVSVSEWKIATSTFTSFETWPSGERRERSKVRQAYSNGV